MSRRLRQQRFFGEDPPPPEPEPDPDDVTAIAVMEQLSKTLRVPFPWNDHHAIDLAIQDAAKIIRERRQELQG